MRVGEMRCIFKDNPHDWCEYGCIRGLKKLSDISDSTPLSEVFYLVVPEWAYHLRKDCKGLSTKVKELAEAKACESSKWAYYLRKDCKGLSAETKSLAEAKACEDPEYAFRLRRYCKDLSIKAKELAEAKACEEPEWAYRLRRYCKDLSAEVKGGVV